MAADQRTIRRLCPSCKKGFRVSLQQLDETVECPHCKTHIQPPDGEPKDATPSIEQAYQDGQMTSCRACQHRVSKSARRCPECGENYPGVSAKAWVWIHVLPIALFVLIVLYSMYEYAHMKSALGI